jgi:hypothetical protein
MRRGEPLTDVRLISPGLLRGYGSGTVAAPVRIADAGSARLLRRGDRVDVWAPPDTDDLAPGPPSGGPPRARLVVASAPVVAVPGGRSETQGALVVLAADRSQAAALAGAGPRLALTITRP